MDAKVTALLLAEGLDSMEDFEKELSSIRSKLDNAIRGNHDLLLPQLLKKLDRRENLKRKIDALSSDSATEHLRRWGLDSVEGLKKAIIETSYNLKKAVNRGHSEIVEEETEKLAAMQQLLCDVSASPLHSPPTICSISSQNDIVEDEESTRLPNAFQVETTGSSDTVGALQHPAPTPDATERPDSHECFLRPMESDDLHRTLNVSLSEMPECAEKNLTRLHEHFKLERIRHTSAELQEAGDSLIATNAELSVYYERLLFQLSTEHLHSVQVDTEIEEFSKLFREYMTLSNPTCGDVFGLLENMEFALFRALRYIAPLDVSYLLNSVRDSIDAATFIKDKDIILLIGSTGVGKSTLMHFLAGSKMRMNEVNGIEYLEPEVVMSGLEDVTFSCSSKSETTGIHAITMHIEGETYLVCDTAGLGDSAGPEQDITSGIVMTRAIRSAKSVKLVLLITQGALSDRYSNLRKTLVPSITRLIPSFGDHVGSIFYLFNMITDRLGGVAARLKDFSSHLEPAEKADVSFTAMIRDLARKADDRTHCAIADMLGGSNVDLLRGFDRLEAIRNPGDAFHDFAAPISINALKDQLLLHRAAVSKGLTRFATSGDKGDLPLIDFKLHQLLELHVTIGLPECSSTYSECVRELSSVIQNLYMNAHSCIEGFFENLASHNNDTELGQCMDMVCNLLELGDICARHAQTTDCVHQVGDPKLIDITKNITGLFERMMQESGNAAMNYIKIVQHDEHLRKTLQPDCDSLPSANQLAVSRLDKMRSLAQLLNRAGDRTTTVLSETYIKAEQLFESQVSALRNIVTNACNEIQINSAKKTYSNCLFPFEQLRALERLDLTPDLHMNEVLSRLIKIFMDRITDDCMDGRRQLEENIPGCGDIFCLALQRALSVTSVPSFKTVIDLERLNMAVDSLTSQVVIACEKARLDFQLLTSGNNDDLFSKLKIDVAFLDILCQESVVTRATAESYHLLVHSVKSTLDLCFRQASQLISAIGIGYMSCPGATALGWRSLEGLLVNIYEASTFHGGLQDVYRRELVDLIEEMSVIIESLNNHVLNGEDGSAISFRSHDRLKSLYSKKCSVLQLSEVVNDNFVTRVPELRQVSYMISASILECDTAVAVAASQAETSFTEPDDALKCDARDALMFFGAAESLGFTSRANNFDARDIKRVENYFMSVGIQAKRLMQSAYMSHQQSVDQTSVGKANEFNDVNALEVKKCFSYLKCYENLLSPCSGHFVDIVTKSIQEAIGAATVDVLCFLTKLNSYAEESGGHSFAVLLVDFELCDMLSVLDEYLPSTDGNLKFAAAAYQIKSAISKVISSTRNKILLCDFDGVLRDLKELKADNPMVATEIRGIVQEALKALSTMSGKVLNTAKSFKLGTTSDEDTLSLFNEVSEISCKSVSIIAFLTEDQIAELTQKREINQGINAIMHMICSECRSRLDDLKVDALIVNYYEAENLLAATERTLPLLERLANSIKTDRTALRNAASHVSPCFGSESNHLEQQMPSVTSIILILAECFETTIMLSNLVTQLKSGKGESTPAVTAYLKVLAETSGILQSKRCLIDAAVSGISSRYSKPLNYDQVRATPPCKLLDDLKRAEPFDARYSVAATSLSDYLVEDVTSTLRSVRAYVESSTTSIKKEPHQEGTAPQSQSGDSLVGTGTEDNGNLSASRVPVGPRAAENIASGHSTGLSDCPITSVEDCEDLVKGIELFTPYFPLEVFGRYQSELVVTKQMIEDLRGAHVTRIEEAMNVDASDCRRSFCLFYQYANANDFMHMKDIGDKMSKQFGSFVEKTKLDLEAGKLSSVLSVLTPSYQTWMRFINILYDWNESRHRNSRYLEKRIGPFFSFKARTVVTFDVKPALTCSGVLQQAILESVYSTISRINKKTVQQIAELEPLFDGLFAFLYPSDKVIWDDVTKLDGKLRENASGGIVSICKHLMLIGSRISKSTAEIRDVIATAVHSPTKNVHALCYDLAEASELLRVAKRNMSLYTKVKELCALPNNPCHNQLRSIVIPSFDEMNAEINATIELIQKTARPSLLDNELLITPNASDRNSFYRRLQMALTLLIRWDGDQAIVNGCVNTRANEESCRDKISSEIELIGTAADRLVDSTDYKRFGMLYDNLRSMSENLSDSTLKDRATGRIKSIDSLFYQRIEGMKSKGWLNDAEWNSQPFEDHLYEKVANELISMKTATTQISHYKKHIDEEFIDKLLKDYSSRPTGAAGTSFFLGLSIYLGGIRTSDAPIASQILADHAAFSGHKLLIRNERILRFTVEDTMHDITCDDETNSSQQLDQAAKDRLIQISRTFEETYWGLVEVALEANKLPQAELESIVEKTKEIADKKDLPLKHKIRELMAHVFAYWTLSESKHYQEAKVRNAKSSDAKIMAVKKNKSLLQPHSGQIVGILRLLGVDEDDTDVPSLGALESDSEAPSPEEKDDNPVVLIGSDGDLPIRIKNHFVQVGTGEGKSVTVAVSAILLSLLGFEVDVVCYSEYLTDRDKGSFKHLIDAFGLSRKIAYGTFKTISEKFINQRGSIREGVLSMISGEATDINQFANRCNIARRVLLVDEVDVFFDDSIYPSYYRPALLLVGPEVTAFIKELWAFHKGGNSSTLTAASIMQWPAYIACRDRYKGWEFVIEESVPYLIFGLQYFDNPWHIYHVDPVRSRIGYKEFDGIFYSTVTSYTMFAYFKEHENGNITKAALDCNIYISGNCGKFSYAALPKMYDSILGVSGTLQELNKSQKKVLREEYNVKRATYLPSVYGSNKLNFDANSTGAIKITNVVEYFKEIVSEITLQIRGKFKDRAVLVFFETKKKLDDFLASSAMIQLRGQVRVIREEDTAADREQAVRQAVTSKSITLMSRDFGRGTDFICFDDDLDASGGVHVVQTFVSMDVSEEKQIKGRTARQGNHGSYSLVLLDTDLEAIGMSIDMIRKSEASGTRYTVIDRVRRAKCETTFNKGLASLESARLKHENSVAFLQALYLNDIPTARKYLKTNFRS